MEQVLQPFQPAGSSLQIGAATDKTVSGKMFPGKTAGLIQEVLKGKGSFIHPTRFVSAGSVTGDTIQLSSQILRSANLQISGSGSGK